MSTPCTPINRRNAPPLAFIDVDELESECEVLSFGPATGQTSAVGKSSAAIDLTAEDDDDDVVCVDAPNFFPIGKRHNPHYNGQPMIVGTLVYPSGNCALVFDPYGRTLVQAEKNFIEINEHFFKFGKKVGHHSPISKPMQEDFIAWCRGPRGFGPGSRFVRIGQGKSNSKGSSVKLEVKREVKLEGMRERAMKVEGEAK